MQEGGQGQMETASAREEALEDDPATVRRDDPPPPPHTHTHTHTHTLRVHPNIAQGAKPWSEAQSALECVVLKRRGFLYKEHLAGSQTLYILHGMLHHLQKGRDDSYSG